MLGIGIRKATDKISLDEKLGLYESSNDDVLISYGVRNEYME
jgi:hypothetical protein